TQMTPKFGDRYGQPHSAGLNSGRYPRRARSVNAQIRTNGFVIGLRVITHTVLDLVEIQSSHYLQLLFRNDITPLTFGVFVPVKLQKASLHDEAAMQYGPCAGSLLLLGHELPNSVHMRLIGYGSHDQPTHLFPLKSSNDHILSLRL